MSTRVTRRTILWWLLGAAGSVVAAFQVPVRLLGRLASSRTRRRIRIPTRPFDERELHRPHDLAG